MNFACDFLDDKQFFASGWKSSFQCLPEVMVNNIDTYGEFTGPV